MGKIGKDIVKVLLSLALGGAILYWMYRDFDLRGVGRVMLHDMDWTWMLLSLPFGVLAQALRGWRWRQTLEPVGERPRMGVSVCAIFLSYAVSLLVPRMGEIARCGVLRRYDGVSFPKAIGTVVTERVIDSGVVALVALLTLVCQLGVFRTFFLQTGTTMDSLLARFSLTGWLVTLFCGVTVVGLGLYLMRQLAIYNKVRHALSAVWAGATSLRGVRHKPLFVAYTLGVWLSYFLHYYLTFYCFEATAHLGMACALVTFIVGSIAVLVPTPNGAGPWHFAVKTMLILYGVAEPSALYFVLIVHSVQTLLVVLLGVGAWLTLSFTEIKQPT